MTQQQRTHHNLQQLVTTTIELRHKKLESTKVNIFGSCYLSTQSHSEATMWASKYTAEVSSRELGIVTGFAGMGSVAAAKKTAFLGNWHSMGSKIGRIAKIFDSVEYPKNRGVTYWAKNIMPLIV